MRTFMYRIVLAGLLGLIANPQCFAADTAGKDAESSAGEKETKRQSFPFRGKIAAIDKSARTITLEGKERPRVIHLTAETRITKDGKPVTLEEAGIGDEAGGLLKSEENGKQAAVSVRLGAKPEPQPKPKSVRQPKKSAAN